MIVIPMAGLSSRFYKSGYSIPKYMLEAQGKTLFAHSVGSFRKYFNNTPFLFIVRDTLNSCDFITQQASAMGIINYSIVTLDQETRGQAETVTLGLIDWDNKRSDAIDSPITIFNIDTFRPDFVFPNLEELDDGYLEVFRGSGENWSFVKPLNNSSTEVIETAEKRQISDLCCTGLYHFKSFKAYLEVYFEYAAKPKSEWEKGEIYVAPLYNLLLKRGGKIHYDLIGREQVIFCGVPDEYIAFKGDRQL
ncbi:glycosyltransferase family 2 protein [Agarivorans sp. 3_MG-2023]|uniref:glycosyltransferase family 2 protein n=2 Tax=unclassified Agarivorans TaxID=2636026 RepID=UPI0026E44170|nr:glycosyltransferase family 2 protein [Agarivorans sp. 3_MG-2023]MDO6685711.1 glycosyltransferase family 2 protein [Agarivorans sp. 3_MG-2023]MDO6716174.1 glycosyltransferase family 2 protein [Agarivorans sp. 2_MG-2023]